MTVEVLYLATQQLELVDVTPSTVELQDVTAGPPGPQGPPGAAAVVLAQLTPLATWTWPHPLGRLPQVTVYDQDGELVDPDIHATTGAVTVTWPDPRTGTAVLT